MTSRTKPLVHNNILHWH